MGVSVTKRAEHVAIVMDGNGRWARAHGLEKIEGHRRGAQAAKKLIPRAKELGISILTLFTFSKENWARDLDEVNALLDLISQELRGSEEEIQRLGVRVRVIGALDDFPEDIAQKVRELEQMSAKNSEITLVFALSYGGRQDIVRAVQQIVARAKAGEITAEQVDDAMIAQHLGTHDFPDPDLFIRSSGELRLSNFLLWEMAYTELYFTTCFWPEFSPDHLTAALDSYAQRQRFYGKSRHD